MFLNFWLWLIEASPVELLHDAQGLSNGVLILMGFFLWRELSQLKRQMVTREGMKLALGEMEVRLRNWVEGRDGRFLDRKEFEARLQDADRVHREFREDITAIRDREADRR